MLESFIQGMVFGVSITLLILWIGIYVWLARVGAIVIEMPKEEDAVHDNTIGQDL